MTVCDVEELRNRARILNFFASKQFFVFDEDWIQYVFQKTVFNVCLEEKEIYWVFQNYPVSLLILVVDYFLSIEEDERIKANYNFFINIFKEWKYRWGIFRLFRKKARIERKQLIRLYVFIRRETKKHYRTI